MSSRAVRAGWPHARFSMEGRTRVSGAETPETKGRSRRKTEKTERRQESPE